MALLVEGEIQAIYLAEVVWLLPQELLLNVPLPLEFQHTGTALVKLQAKGLIKTMFSINKFSTQQLVAVGNQ